MFPHLVAGPIVRYAQVQEDLAQRGPNRDLFTFGLYRFLLGLNKKILIANSVAPLTDAAFHLSQSNHLLKDFFRDIDGFFADNFPLREQLLNISKETQALAKADLDSKKCYRGLDDWLFLGNDYAHCVNKLEGTEPLKQEKLQKAINTYSSIAKKCKDAESTFAIIVGPNKSSVYPEYLPPIIIPAENRYLTPLVEALQQNGITVYDPINNLRKAKQDGLLYYRTDTHWNARGGFVAFEGIRKILNLPKLHLSFIKGPLHRGDLVHIGGYKNREYHITTGDNFQIQWKTVPQLTRNEEAFPCPTEPQGSNDGVEVKNTNATTEKTLWVFTDSFNAAMRPYFLASFKETSCFKQADFDRVMKSQRPKPDVILWVHVKRDFI